MFRGSWRGRGEGLGRGNVIEISKYQLNIRQRAAKETEMAAAAEVYGSQWNYLLCFVLSS